MRARVLQQRGLITRLQPPRASPFDTGLQFEHSDGTALERGVGYEPLGDRPREDVSEA